MQTVSAKFLATIRGPHRVVAYADITQQGQTISLPIADGTVTIDRTQQVRRTRQITFATPYSSKAVATGSLSPYLTRIILRRGVRYGDQTEETVPLGLFAVDDVAWDEDDASVTVTGSDLTSLVQRANMVVPRTVSDASTLKVISNLIGEAFAVPTPGTNPPYLTTGLAATDNLIIMPGVVDKAVDLYELSNQGRWDAISDLALRLGAMCYAHPSLLKWRIMLLPSPTGTPVETIDAGPTGVLTAFKRSQSRDGVINAVYATSTEAEDSSGNPVTPVSAWAYDSTLGSPTYVGTYGWAVEQIDSSGYGTQAACQAGADQYLASKLGLLNQLSLTAVPNPALEAGDVIKVAYPDGSTENHIIDALTIGLGLDTDFAVTTRATQG